MKKKQLKPFIVFHPGVLLLDEIEARNKQCKTCKHIQRYTQQQFSKDSGLHPRAVNEIIKGKRPITEKSARKIAKAFGTTPQLWVKMQQEYDLSQIKD